MSAVLENLQLACGVCRIGCYMIYRKLCCKPPLKARPEFAPICIGLSGSGKTTLLTILAGESTENIQPTSGSDKVRPFWKHYYRGAHALIFVIDSACSEEELDIAGTELHTSLSNPLLNGIPCLVLANCQDKPGAKNLQQLRDELDLEAACDGRKWAMHACNMRDRQEVREGFDKLTAFLLTPEGANNTGHSVEDGGNYI